ncbi:hypothetical protein [Enterococcus rivorum]|uniref:hypothetical protein n=1 Tax=Enterococcus rivorum TaxID=762845 RepID=UPI00363670D4
MPKRGENIYKRKDGRWEGRYIKNRQVNGAIQYGYVYSKTYKETKEKLNILKAKFQTYQQKTITYYDNLPNYMEFG